jgi:two-component system, OmpR family, sensor histidine kinase KdpD
VAFHPAWVRAVRDVTIGVGVIAATVLALSRVIGTRDPTTVALTLLLIVLGTATLSVLWVAISTALLSTLAFNYFFLPPVGAFTIADPHNWVALFAFLAVSIIASQLSTAARTRASEADARRLELDRLFDLSRDILLMTETDGALVALARQVARRFELDAVAICLPSSAAWDVHQGGRRDVVPSRDELDHAFARLRGPLEYDARRRAYGGHSKLEDGTGRPISIVPLRLGSRPVGLLATDAGGLQVGTLDAVAGVIAIAIERTHFLKERKEAEAVSQRADLASALLASFSHDLRTPLTTVRMAVANLQEAGASADDRRVQARLALSEIDRLTRLFQDILDMARIDAAAIRAELQWVTPADVVDAAVAHAGPVLASRTLRITADSTREAKIDPRLTSAALAHVLENAASYTPAERPIDIEGRTDADGLQLSVRDYGPGLQPSEMDRIFEPFYRAPTIEGHSAGTGMGLAITRGLLAAENGRVWAENTTDGGARFAIAVPAAVRRLEAQVS